MGPVTAPEVVLAWHPCGDTSWNVTVLGSDDLLAGVIRVSEWRYAVSFVRDMYWWEEEPRVFDSLEAVGRAVIEHYLTELAKRVEKALGAKPGPPG